MDFPICLLHENCLLPPGTGGVGAQLANSKCSKLKNNVYMREGGCGCMYEGEHIWVRTRKNVCLYFLVLPLYVACVPHCVWLC